MSNLFGPRLLRVTGLLASGLLLVPYALAGVPRNGPPVLTPVAPEPLRAKGVPTMEARAGTTPAPDRSPLPATPYRAGVGRSLLDEEGYLRRPVSDREYRAWATEVHEGAGSERRGRLLLQIGETQLARHWPAEAQRRFDEAAAILPVASPDRGLARYDSALSLFLQGRYEDAGDAFRRVAASPLRGVDRRTATMYARHSGACAGYHAQHAALGIPQPPFLDPFCGVAGLAVVLRGHGMRHDRDYVASRVRHDGEGSNMGDLLAALPRLGLTGRMVSADDAGLRRLPMPLVAHVERDHFVAVVKADAEGVSYVCSDCGPWPGGRVDLDWRQWHALEADRYLAVASPGSPEAVALASLPTDPSQGPGRALLAGTGVGDPSVYAAAGRLLDLFGTSVLGQTSTVLLALTPFCGGRGTSPHCVCGVNPCPKQSAGGGSPHSPHDPVNLATTEEEYDAPGGLHVYNPTGPSVDWTHSYYSLANVTPNGFGSGWTHPYNVRIEDNSAIPTGGGALSGGGSGSNSTFVGSPSPSAVVPPASGPTPSVLVLPNSARIQFTADPNNPPTTSSPVRHLVVQAGYPMLVDWRYGSGATYFVVTTSDRTQWRFEPCNGTSSATGRCYPVRITDRSGNWIGLNWATFTFKTIDPAVGGFIAKGLTSITDSSGSALLTLAYDGNARVTNVSDRYGRSVYYTVQSFANTGVPSYVPYQANDELTQASVIVPTGTASPMVRFQYGYQNYGNTEQAASETIPYLHTIQVPSATGAGLAKATINYDSIGEVTGSVDANGNQTVYSGAPAAGGGTQSNSGRVQVKDPQGNLVSQHDVTFDNRMNQTGLVNGVGQTVWTRAYADPNTPFRASSHTDGNNRTWSFTWDAFGQMKTATTPKNVVTTNTWDYTQFALGELTSVKRTNQTATSYTYNEPSGLVATVSTPIPGQTNTGSTQTTSYVYDAVGNLTQVLSPGNNAVASHSTSFGYTTDGGYTQPERLGEPITVTDSLGKTTHLRYDARRNQTSSTDALGNATATTYDLADQPLVATLPATGQTGGGSSTRTNAYLYTNGPLVQTNAANEAGVTVRTVSLAYGKEGETLSRTGSVETATLTYDAAYRTKTLAGGNGNTTTYAYDLADRATSVVYPGATGATYDRAQFTAYDPLGHVLNRTDGNGQTTSYTYGDADGLLSAVAYPGKTASNVSVTYDVYDRATGVNDGTGSATIVYDDLGYRLSSTRTYSGLSAQTFSYAFWPDGSRKTMTNPAGTWTYGYDAAGRYASLTSPAGTSSATYLDNGWEASRTLPNGATTTYAYNAMGLLSGLTNQTSGGATLSQYGSLAYDGVFNLTGVSAAVPGTTAQGGATTYAYDAKDRLTQETSARGGGYAGAFAYDASGNPTNFKGAAQGFDADDRQTSGGGAFVYDGNGNPTTYKGTALAYDPENRATGIGAAWTAGYRADGLRGWKSVSGTKTYYLYDRGEPVVELDASGNVTGVNVFAPDGLVARKQSGAWTQYAFDPQGNVAQRLNASQAVVSSSIYDAYGTESSSGTPADTFGFDARWGYLLDRETGLYLCQHRYYDSGAGRWLTRDPIGSSGGVDLYSYCAQSPIRASDAWGLLSDNAASAAVLAAMAAGDEGPAEQAADAALERLGGIADEAEPTLEEAARQGKVVCDTFFRVVDEKEHDNLVQRGGCLQCTFGGPEGKYGWRTASQAREYFEITRNTPYKPYSIWSFPWPDGFGRPGGSEGLDGVPGFSVFFPLDQIPLIPPGTPLEGTP